MVFHAPNGPGRSDKHADVAQLVVGVDEVQLDLQPGAVGLLGERPGVEHLLQHVQARQHLVPVLLALLTAEVLLADLGAHGGQRKGPGCCRGLLLGGRYQT